MTTGWSNAAGCEVRFDGVSVLVRVDMDANLTSVRAPVAGDGVRGASRNWVAFLFARYQGTTSSLPAPVATKKRTLKVVTG